jgi:hypothetical protein
MPVRRVLACLVIVMASAIGLSSTAVAGNAGGYKIEFSNNCNNPSVCFQLVGALGGDWASIRLNPDGTGTAEFTSATHQTPNVPNGAVHYSLVLTWSTFSSPSAPPPAAVTADPNGNYLVINTDIGSLVTPATPGHYSYHGGPGVNFMLQIQAT